MIADIAKAVGPYLFKGGSPADYLTGIGPAGSFFTMHRASRQVIQSVVPVAEKVAKELPLTNVLSAVNGLYNTRLLQKVQQGVQMANVLGAVNLGVNLVNLGVGVYNAYQLRQVRKQMDVLAEGQREIQGSISDLAAFSALTAERVEATLRQHGIVLGLLYHSGEETHRRIDHLRAEMHARFNDLFASQLAAEARAVRRELDARQSAALRHYRAVHSTLEAGREPSARELASVVDSSVELIAWADALRKTELPSAPARMPLLAVKATGIRMLLDARELESPGTPIVKDERIEFLKEVSSDAAALVSDRSVRDLALDLYEVVAGYVYLHRAFGVRVEVGYDDKARAIPLIPPGEFVWDDRLHVLRMMTAGLSTEVGEQQEDKLPDADWLAEWEADFGTRALPSAADVLAALSLPVADVSADELARLKRLAVRSGRTEIARHLQKTFGWATLPRLIPATNDN